MTTSSNDYHISFFKPTTPQAKANRNMVVWLFCIWAVAIFGFHFLMRIIEKPVPEKSLTAFNSVWDNVKNGEASEAELQVFAKSTLSVLGKIMIQPEDKAVLDNALSWSVMQLADSTQLADINMQLTDFETIKSEIEDIGNEEYIDAKNSLNSMVAPVIGLDAKDVRARILPFELESSQMDEFKPENISKMADVMELYLTHNRSFLTDTKFLGFPFHYFYSAVFLLVLFVGLCWLYCKRTDKMNEAMNIHD